ncbi:MAG: DNA translocase FtsK 4TM domain-containing protein [Patescibacteria group bacterium]|jgi:S-DNA-T family DNA segregation ATPase FtsK/SpoIIIE
MARRGRKRKLINRLYSPGLPSMPSMDLDPATKKGIYIVIILTLGAIGVLSLFDLAGSLGIYYAKGLTYVFGWGKFMLPLALLGLGYLLYASEKYHIRGSNYLGLFLFVVAMEAMFQLFIGRDEWKAALEEGRGGGYLGYFMGLGLTRVLGLWAAIILVISLIIISLMLVFDTTLSAIIGSDSIFAKAWSGISRALAFITRRKNGEKAENEPEETEPEDETAEEEISALTEFSARKINPALDAKKLKAKEEEKPWKTSHVKIDLPLDLLSDKITKPMSGDIKNNAEVIERTLKNFGIAVGMGEVSVGPTVTQYTFKPAEGIKLAKITTLGNDLALALAAHPIRIEAPIPGKSLVGVEVPNQTKAIVGLRQVLESKEFKERKANLYIGLGKDVSGKPWTYNIPKMPHLLVAGATNSGKSVCLNSIIVSLLYQNNPDDLRFIMVDPKRVELPIYNGIPHLLTPVITNVDKTINALKWCLNEMDRRFDELAKHGKRNIQSYNESAKDKYEKMPYIVFIIDELADLMVVAARDVETAVIRLAQMARAVGIHLILATQRPSVDVITGLIKANMPARIAFSVASSIDSRTILDSLGAEKLLGSGDMLFVTAELSKPKRIQGAFVSDNEIKKIVRYIKENGGETNYIEGITDRQKVKGIGGAGMSGGDADSDDLFEEAKEIVINMGRASTSLLQRRLSVGYSRAAKLIDLLEENGIVGPGNGSKPREIMVSREQYEGMIETGVSGVSLHNRDEAVAPDEYLPGSIDNEDENEEDEGDEDADDEDAEDDDNDTGRPGAKKSAKKKIRYSKEEIKEVDDLHEDDEEPEDALEKISRKKKTAGTAPAPDDNNEKRAEDEDDDDGMYFAK